MIHERMGEKQPRAKAPTLLDRSHEFSKTGFCGAMPRIRAVSKSAIESNSNVRKWVRISSQRWHLVFILFQVAWNNGQHAC